MVRRAHKPQHRRNERDVGVLSFASAHDEVGGRRGSVAHRSTRATTCLTLHPQDSMFRSTLPLLVVASAVFAQEPTPPAGQPPVAQQPTFGPGLGPRRPRPYAVVVNERAKTERGGITVHHVDERWLFE